jgi:hypothetical protein
MGVGTSLNVWAHDSDRTVPGCLHNFKKGDGLGKSGRPVAPSRNTMNPASVTLACSHMSCFLTVTTTVWVRR